MLAKRSPERRRRRGIHATHRRLPHPWCGTSKPEITGASPRRYFYAAQAKRFCQFFRGHEIHGKSGKCRVDGSIQAPMDTWSGRERAPSTAGGRSRRLRSGLLWDGDHGQVENLPPRGGAGDSGREGGRPHSLACAAGLDGAKHPASSHQAIRPRPTGRGPREQQVHTQAKKEADQNQRGPKVSAR